MLAAELGLWPDKMETLASAVQERLSLF
jgi:hypothetical protein